MSMPVNLFELLEDENDTEKKPASASTAKTTQKAAPAATTQQKKAEPAKKTDRPNEAKGKDTRAPAKSDKPQERKQGAPRDVAAQGTGSGSPAPRNRPPRQQHHDGERKDRPEHREERPGHREFDRRSGTGRGKETKRSGGGRANWGTAEDDKKAQLETPTEATEQKEEATEAQPTDAKAESTEAQAEQKEEPKDEDANLKTLEEFQKQIKRPTISLPPPRTVDAPTDSKLFVLTKSKEEDLSHKKEKKDDKKEDPTKKVISADKVIDFTRREEPREKSFRGGKGRGGPRDSPRESRDSRDSRDSPKGNRFPNPNKRGPKSPAPNVQDESSFPALNTAVKG